MPRHLPVLQGFPTPSGPGDALYVAPGPNHEGRLCMNCVLWQPPQRCVIHAPDVRVTRSMVCGYHVLGAPLSPFQPNPLRVTEYVTPATSGLIEAPRDGTRCGNCMWFSQGYCMRVGEVVEPSSQQWSPAKVDFDGCCAQWTSG